MDSQLFDLQAIILSKNTINGFVFITMLRLANYILQNGRNKVAIIDWDASMEMELSTYYASK